MARAARSPFRWHAAADQLVIAGALDEDARLVPLVAHARDGRLALELSGITFINSIGVREWVRLQAAALAATVHLELHRVAETLIHQLNIVPAAREASTVRSFFASYLCEHCDDDHAILLDVGVHGEALRAMSPPPMTCPTCGRALSFGNPPELYFTFLTGGSALS